MRVININPLTKKRIKIMAKSLIPWVGYVRVAYSGLVTLKTRWWSLHRTQLSVTDLCLQELPKRIADSATKRNLGLNYLLLFRETIASYLELQFVNGNFDVSEYLWDVFNKYHMEIPSIEKIPDLRKQLVETNLSSSKLPILTIASYNSLYGIHEIFKNLRENTVKNTTNKLIKRIKSIQNNMPARIFKFGLVFG